MEWILIGSEIWLLKSDLHTWNEVNRLEAADAEGGSSLADPADPSWRNLSRNIFIWNCWANCWWIHSFEIFSLDHSSPHQFCESNRELRENSWKIKRTLDLLLDRLLFRHNKRHPLILAFALYKCLVQAMPAKYRWIYQLKIFLICLEWMMGKMWQILFAVFNKNVTELNINFWQKSCTNIFYSYFT